MPPKRGLKYYVTLQYRVLRYYGPPKSRRYLCIDKILVAKSISFIPKIITASSLNHPILPRKIEKDKMKTNIERLTFRLTNNTETHCVDKETKNEIKFLFKQFVDAGNRICSKRTDRSLQHTLNKLPQDPTIKICRYDKGNGLAILDVSGYNKKLNSIVRNKTKFSEIEYDSKKLHHPTITKENSITYYIKQYLKKVQGWEDLIPNVN